MIFDIQKASITKRLVAFILDMILFAILAVGFAWALGAACDYDTHLAGSINTQNAYVTYFKRGYGVDFSISYDNQDEAGKALWETFSEQFEGTVNKDVPVKITTEKLLQYREKYLASHGVDLLATDKEFNDLSSDMKTAWLAAYDACSAELKAEFGENAFLMKPIAYFLAYEEEYGVDLTLSAIDRAGFNKDQAKNWNKAYEKLDHAFSKDLAYGARMMRIIGFTLMMVSLGVLLSMAVLEFVVPLLFKNGQTIGKKVFGIGVVHQNGVRVNTITMFIRTFLGKYAVETMVPVLLVLMLFMGNGLIAVIVMALIIALELGLFFWKKDTRPFIHDVFAKTVAVDLASQMIFDNEVEMAQFRRNAYAETAGDSSADTLYGTSKALNDSFVQIDKKDNSDDNEK